MSAENKDIYTPAGWKFPKEAEIFRIPMNGKYYTRERFMHPPKIAVRRMTRI